MLVYPCEECGSLSPVDDLCGAQIQELSPMPALVERVAKAVGENFLYPDPKNEGNWMGPGIQAARQVAIRVLDALTGTSDV